MSGPAVTVLMPAFNAGVHLREAVASVVAQTFCDFELLVIDDGSTDGSIRALEAFRDPRIRCVRNETNLGLVASLNRGLSEARGMWIARQDADDVSAPGRLAAQLGFARGNPAVPAIGCDAWLVDEAGRLRGRWRTGGHADLVAWDLCFRTPFCHSTAMFRREYVMDRLKGYRDLPACEDYDLWARIAADNVVVTLREPLVKYRLHRRSLMAGVNDARPSAASAALARSMRRYLERICPGVDATAVDAIVDTWTGDMAKDWRKYFRAADEMRMAFLRGRRPPRGFERLCAEQSYMLWGRMGRPGELLAGLREVWPNVWWRMPWIRMAAAGMMR